MSTGYFVDKAIKEELKMKINIKEVKNVLHNQVENTLRYIDCEALDMCDEKSLNIRVDELKNAIKALEQQQAKIKELEKTNYVYKDAIQQALDCHKKHKQLLYFDVSILRNALPQPPEDKS